MYLKCIVVHIDRLDAGRVFSMILQFFLKSHKEYCKKSLLILHAKYGIPAFSVKPNRGRVDAAN